MKICKFLIFLWLQPWKRPLQLNIMVFCPEHHKRDQNLKFTPLSETMSIPVPFISAIETKPLVYVLKHGSIMVFFVCTTSSQVWISFLNPGFALPCFLGSLLFCASALASNHLTLVRLEQHFTFLLVCSDCVYHTGDPQAYVKLNYYPVAVVYFFEIKRVSPLMQFTLILSAFIQLGTLIKWSILISREKRMLIIKQNN